VATAGVRELMLVGAAQGRSWPREATRAARCERGSNRFVVGGRRRVESRPPGTADARQRLAAVLRGRSNARSAFRPRQYQPLVARRGAVRGSRSGLVVAEGGHRPVAIKGHVGAPEALDCRVGSAYAAVWRLSRMILGCRAAMRSSAIAGPSGVRRPCSQFRRVCTLIPMARAN